MMSPNLQTDLDEANAKLDEIKKNLDDARSAAKAIFEEHDKIMREIVFGDDPESKDRLEKNLEKAKQNEIYTRDLMKKHTKARGEIREIESKMGIKY